MCLFKKGVALMLAVTLALAFAACGRQTAETNDSLKARFASLYETDAIAEMLADPAANESEIASYGLDDFASTFPNADAFRSYTVEISLQNTNDFDVQVLNVQMETENQGKNGVWFSLMSESPAMGLPAHYTGDEALFYYAIAEASLSKEDVLQRLGEMGISCVYMQGSEAPDTDAQIDPSLLFSSAILYEG